MAIIVIMIVIPTVVTMIIVPIIIVVVIVIVVPRIIVSHNLQDPPNHRSNLSGHTLFQDPHTGNGLVYVSEAPYQSYSLLKWTCNCYRLVAAPLENTSPYFLHQCLVSSCISSFWSMLLYGLFCFVINCKVSTPSP